MGLSGSGILLFAAASSGGQKEQVSCSALMMFGLGLLLTNTSALSGIPEILVIPAIGGLLAALGCSISFVLEVLFLYRDLQKISDDKNRGFCRYILKAALWTFSKQIFLTLLGAVLISLTSASQFGLPSIYQFTKKYNPTALTLFALAVMLILSYGIYITYLFFYPFLLKPFDELFVKYFRFSLSPHVPFREMAGLLIGGTTLCVVLLLAATMIDPQITLLINDLTVQIVEAKKILIQKQQFN